jgi:hypothetical protein
MTKLYAFAFWNIRQFFKRMYDDGYADWKALAVIGCTEILGIMAAVFMVSIAVGYKLLPSSKPVLWILGAGISLGIAGINYYMLRFENKWTRFEREFNSYSTGVRILSGIAIAAVVMATIFTAFASAAAAGRLPGNSTEISLSNF